MQKIELNIPLRLHSNWSAIAQRIEACLTGPETQGEDYTARIEIRPIPVLVISYTHTQGDGFRGDVRNALSAADSYCPVNAIHALAYVGGADTVWLGSDIYQPNDGERQPLTDFIRA